MGLCLAVNNQGSVYCVVSKRKDVKGDKSEIKSNYILVASL